MGYSIAYGQACEDQLASVREELIILQDQHAMITIPRAEADQRLIIVLRRQLEQAKMTIKQLGEKDGSQHKDDRP